MGGPGCQGLTLSDPTLHRSLVATEGLQPLPLDSAWALLLATSVPAGFVSSLCATKQGQYLRILLLLLNVGWCWRTRLRSPHMHAWTDRERRWGLDALLTALCCPHDLWLVTWIAVGWQHCCPSGTWSTTPSHPRRRAASHQTDPSLRPLPEESGGWVLGCTGWDGLRGQLGRRRREGSLDKSCQLQQREREERGNGWGWRRQSRGEEDQDFGPGKTSPAISGEERGREWSEDQLGRWPWPEGNSASPPFIQGEWPAARETPLCQRTMAQGPLWPGGEKAWAAQGRQFYMPGPELSAEGSGHSYHSKR